MRQDVQFPTADGKISLRGWFYTPDKTPAPCIIMTHGFSALKEHFLDKFAKKICEAGFCVLVYDNRNFGDSDKEMPLEVDPVAQIQDVRNAITYVENRTDTIPKQIGVWGTSFSGGIMIQATAFDERIQAVVTQVPMVNGWMKALRQTRPDVWQKRVDAFNEDRCKRQAGNSPEMIAVVAKNPQDRAIMPQADAYAFFTSVAKWPNKVTLKSLENSGEFEPHFHLTKIAPRPILFIVAREDTINPANLSAHAFSEALEPKQIVYIKGDHFAPYYDEQEFQTCVSAAINFFATNLQPPCQLKAKL